jgi:hypothetical protein
MMISAETATTPDNNSFFNHAHDSNSLCRKAISLSSEIIAKKDVPEMSKREQARCKVLCQMWLQVLVSGQKQT